MPQNAHQRPTRPGPGWGVSLEWLRVNAGCVLAVNMKANAEEMTGFFVRRYPNGLYEGDMFGGKMEGKGRFAFRGGDVYEGDWLDNKVPILLLLS